jgi:CRP/FNR family transcriptional regulator
MAGKKSSNKQLIDLLREVPLFSSCTKKELSALASAGKEVNHPAGHVICHEGEVGYGLHVVIEGETRVEVGGRTRRRLGPGAFFGEIALLDKGPRTATVIAETDTITFVLASWNFRSVLKSQPGLAVKMLEETSRRIRSIENSFTH